jgi:hypothetical protein
MDVRIQAGNVLVQHGETIGARKRSELSSQWSRNPEEQEMLMD